MENTAQEQMQIISALVVAKRTEAINARKESGIEAVMLKCEESYVGIDDANREEYSDANWTKPTSMSGVVTSREGKKNSANQSNVFVRLTARYVDAGAAKLGEILLPVDGKPFSLTPTPVPELSKVLEDKRIVPNALTGKPIMRKPTEKEVEDGALPEQVKATTYADIAQSNYDKAEIAAEAAEKRIYDWLVECNYDGVARKVIFDAARLGTGVLKAPVPVVQKSRSISKKDNVTVLEYIEKVVPAAKWVDTWNLFPDKSCGEDIHNGTYIFERDFLSPKSLEDLIGQKGYLESQIVKVLKEGANKSLVDAQNKKIDDATKNRYEVWYFYGSMSREELEPLYTMDELPEGQRRFDVIATIVNDSIIRAIINPMEGGGFPFRVMRWSRRAGSWTGIGVAEQADVPQRILNASTRALLNNAGYSSGVQIVIDQQGLTPADENWTITPNKIWVTTGETTATDIRQMMSVLEFPNIGNRLMEIIQYAFKLAEESTSIPLITQGQTGATTPETLGAVQLQNNNAATLLRSVGYAFDDTVTEPMINSFYEWLLLDPDVPEEEKGDFRVNAKGSAAMVERAINDIALQNMAGMVLNPVFGVDPQKWFTALLLSKRIDPTTLMHTKEELEKMAAQEQPPPIQIQLAQMKAEAESQKEQFKAQMAKELEQMKAQFEAQHQMQAQEVERQMLADGTAPQIVQMKARIEQEKIKAQGNQLVQESRANTEQVRAGMEVEIARQNQDFRLQELQLQREKMMLEYSLKNNMSLEKTKAELAKVSMVERNKLTMAQQEINLAIEEGQKDRLAKIHKETPSLVRDTMNNPNTP